jgi:glycosyltransferase involved in cell wall biosynthesis
VTVHFVLPGDIDDPAEPSGGNVYDRRVSAAAGQLREHPVPGPWPLPDAAGAARLAEVLDALPDGATVLLDGLCACGTPEVVVPRAGRLRLAVLVHLPLADETGLPPRLAADLADRERRVLAAASVVVTTSPWAARSVVDRHGVPAERVRVVEPGVSWSGGRASAGAGGRLVCVASLTRRKAQDVLVRALAEVADLPWRCTLVGPLTRDPEYVRAVRSLVDTHGLGGRVDLCGPLTGDPLEAVYLDADLLVLPSRAETYGMVVTEALARGVPVLASDVGGIPDALGADAGVLVPPDDVPALADALHRWLTDAELRTRLRAAARSTTPRTWEQAAAELLAAVAP